MLHHWFEKDRINDLKGIDKELDIELDNLKIIYNDHYLLLQALKEYSEDYNKGKFGKIRAEIRKIEKLIQRDISLTKKEEKITLKATEIINGLLQEDSIKEKQIDHELEMKLDLLREHLKSLERAIKKLSEFFRKYGENYAAIEQNIHKLIEAVDEISTILYNRKKEIVSVRSDLCKHLQEATSIKEGEERDKENFFTYTYPTLKQLESAGKALVARIEKELDGDKLTLKRFRVYEDYYSNLVWSLNTRLAEYQDKRRIVYSDTISIKIDATIHRVRGFFYDDLRYYIWDVGEYLKGEGSERPKFKQKTFFGRRYFSETFKARKELDDINELIDDTIWLKEESDRKFIHQTQGKKLMAFFDVGLLKLVLTEFLQNAIYWTSKNGKIEIGAIKERENIKIWIKDSGKGIPKKDIPHIFDSQFTKREGGSGRGLAYNLYIIQKYFEGDIEVKSKIGKGTIFTIIIPYKKIKPPK